MAYNAQGPKAKISVAARLSACSNDTKNKNMKY